MRSWLKERKARAMTPTEAAWLAGFFDGEGCLCRNKSGRNNQHFTWALTCTNTHKLSLEKCLKITGAGKVLYKGTPLGHKPQWIWKTQAQRDVKFILEQMLPFLVVKSKIAKLFLREFVDIEQ